MVTGVFPVTEEVVMLNGATVDPAGRVTEGATAASDGAELDNATTTPPVGAGVPRMITFEGEVSAPIRVDGSNITVRAWAPKVVFSIFCER
jgi:hypothetical protein